MRLPCRYPAIFLKPKSRIQLINIFIEIYRRLFLLIFEKKSHFDIASFWSKNLVSFAGEYLKINSINNLIVSGPPSSLHLAGALIKSELPGLRLIQDYRDPWSNVHDVSIKTLGSVDRKRKILEAELLSLQVADQIVVVTNQMSLELQNIFSTPSEKITVISNGFDSEDYLANEFIVSTSRSKKIKVVYMGQFSLDPQGRLEALGLVADALELLPIGYQERYEFHLYSDIPVDYFKNSASLILRTKIKCHPMVPRSLVYKVIDTADICLSINRREDGYAIPSKLYDYLGANKSILQIAPFGEVSEILINANQYVINYELGNAIEVMKKIVDDFDGDNGLSPIDHELYSNFEISKLAL
jgi:glycosyltransferase involved in cell wall biosynthesis